jgi:acyl-CoA synthetase (AMP-forming)/AMP-acid ligase II
VIIRGGFKVHPAKVSRVLEEHPSVREAEVVGLPDTRLGEIPIAGVLPTSGASVSAAELREWCETRLAKYELPAEIVVLDSLPRTPSLKVDRPALRKIGADALLASRREK